MEHNRVIGLLSAYLDNEVTVEERRQVEEHLPGCKQCREELSSLKATQEVLCQTFLDQAAVAELPARAWDGLRHRLEIEDVPPAWLRVKDWLMTPAWHAISAVALVMVLVVSLLWGTGVLPGLIGYETPVPASTTNIPSATPPPPSVIFQIYELVPQTSPLGDSGTRWYC